MASISAVGFLQISPVFTPQVFGFTDASQLSPSLLLFPALEQNWQPSQASAPTGMPNSSLFNPLERPPPPRTQLRLAPPAVLLHAADLMHITGLHCNTHAQGEITRSRESAHSQGSTAASEPPLGTDPCCLVWPPPLCLYLPPTWHSMDTCSWSPELSMCTPLASATAAACPGL